MILPTGVRRALAGVAVFLLLAFAWLGISGGVGQWSEQVTFAQRMQYAMQALYGVGALFMVVTAFRWRRWRSIAEIAFAIGALAAAGLATVVWGEQSILSGVFAGVGALVIALALIWMLRAGFRAPAKPGE